MCDNLYYTQQAIAVVLILYLPTGKSLVHFDHKPDFQWGLNNFDCNCISMMLSDFNIYIGRLLKTHAQKMLFFFNG